MGRRLRGREIMWRLRSWLGIEMGEGLNVVGKCGFYTLLTASLYPCQSGRKKIKKVAFGRDLLSAYPVS